ncbi:hypothetical protein 2 [Xinzhou nematode virus 4]|uniref:Uncharacterized protein n=1 Tax=Xinzhou nematode virus 4 TaxID=1923772 RepID=A0A1L3KNA0_9RHAB|nr:hypothetical protein 2 [Xinzhou nematode virus 4]APG78854.1 hypothetical protein 2 [Xinzhou nematode virus 4]
MSDSNESPPEHQFAVPAVDHGHLARLQREINLRANIAQRDSTLFRHVELTDDSPVIPTQQVFERPPKLSTSKVTREEIQHARTMSIISNESSKTGSEQQLTFPIPSTDCDAESYIAGIHAACIELTSIMKFKIDYFDSNESTAIVGISKMHSLSRSTSSTQMSTEPLSVAPPSTQSSHMDVSGTEEPLSLNEILARYDDPVELTDNLGEMFQVYWKNEISHPKELLAQVIKKIGKEKFLDRPLNQQVCLMILGDPSFEYLRGIVAPSFRR